MSVVPTRIDTIAKQVERHGHLARGPCAFWLRGPSTRFLLQDVVKPKEQRIRWSKSRIAALPMLRTYRKPDYQES